MPTIISPTEARTITKDSAAHFNNCIAECEKAIKEAAKEGKTKCYMPQFENSIQDKVRDFLVTNGYKIDKFSSDIWNSAIYW